MEQKEIPYKDGASGPYPRERRLVRKVKGSKYFMVRGLTEKEKSDSEAMRIDGDKNGWNKEGKEYSRKGLADFLIWNQGKEGIFAQIICSDLEIFEDLREYWKSRDKSQKRPQTYGEVFHSADTPRMI